jgi:branched-chain amino acid transport system substrate-binding protein
MNMPGKRLLATVAVLGLALSSALAADGKVTIGIVTAQTGPLAAPGKFQMNGFNLAVEEINKAAASRSATRRTSSR